MTGAYFFLIAGYAYSCYLGFINSGFVVEEVGKRNLNHFDFLVLIILFCILLTVIVAKFAMSFFKWLKEVIDEADSDIYRANNR